MSIEPGTRVRSTKTEFPEFIEGTFVGMNYLYYMIKWDSTPKHKPPHLHTQSEFEVI